MVVNIDNTQSIVIKYNQQGGNTKQGNEQHQTTEKVVRLKK